MTIEKSVREKKLATAGGRYRDAVAAVRGGVKAVLLMPTVVEGWAWLLLRASLDIAEKELNAEEMLVTDLSGEAAIVALIERAGSRLALPDGFDQSAWKPSPTIEFWKSHTTGAELPNPWVVDDKSDQLWVRKNLGDAFAEELEIAAQGGRTYASEFQRRMDSQLADAAKSWPPEKLNPFAPRPAGYARPDVEWHTWSAGEIRRIEQSNPPLAAWLAKIATPIYANPFEGGEAHDLTKQMLVLKSDGRFARHLQRTANWKSSQLDAELLEAERLANDARIAAENAKAAAKERQRLAR
ncbi:MAG: hypothetical protein IH623_23300 [Verrucomicrobia bacterium]|nr:hypothetical protein [Verrucomicrobiota bacterium]